jgi:putative DNA primase/helicase
MTQQSANFDVDVALNWIATLHGSTAGQIHICSTGDWVGRKFDQKTNTAAEMGAYLTELDRLQRSGIYLRVSTLAPTWTPNRDRPGGLRGGIDDSWQLPAFWADLDIAGPGHKTDKPLPRDRDDIEDIIDRSGLPIPSTWIHSGGGMYPIWMFERPLDISEPEQRAHVARQSTRWQAAIERASIGLGFSYGAGVGDLARVLRIPGTVNRKVTGDPRQCRIVESLPHITYRLDRIGILLDGLQPPEPSRALVVVPDFRAVSPRVETIEEDGWHTGRTELDPNRLKPGDDFKARGDIRDILVPAGYQILTDRGHYIEFVRPGKKLSEGISCTWGANGVPALHMFSDADNYFRQDETVDLLGVYARIHHRGDVQVAVSQLAREGYGDPLPARSEDVALSTIFPEGEIVEPTVDDLMPSPSDPIAVARIIAKKMPSTDGVGHHLMWRGNWYEWHGAHWTEMPSYRLLKWLYLETEHATFIGGTAKNPVVKPWSPTQRKINDLTHAMAHAVTQRDSEAEPDQCIALANGVLDVNTGTVSPHSPARFNLHSLPYGFDVAAKCPNWLAFLESILGDDHEAIRFLQEWFGYIVSGRTNIHKMCSIIGPPRSGKGTIGRIMAALLNPNAIANPEMRKLASQFGEQGLIGKTLTVISDVRWESREIQDAVPVLLAITGEDHRSVPQKNKEDWHGRLGTRFMMMSNDIPKFRDASGALANRIIHVELTKSFLGKEDASLEGKLLAELPGILNWALAGLKTLTARGRFVAPASGDEINTDVMRSANPAFAFVEDWCEIREGASTGLDALFDHYLKWCVEQHQEYVGNKTTFSKNIQNAFRGVIAVHRIREPGGRRWREVDGLRVRPGASMEVAQRLGAGWPGDD